MSDKTIEEKFRDIIVEQLGLRPEDIKNESRFREDLGADSLDEIELIIAAEEEFGLEISDDDAEKVLTFGAAVKFLEERAVPPSTDSGDNGDR